MKFWIFWGIDAVVALVVLYFFFIGLADGSVSSFNAGIWSALVLALGGVIGGSLALRSAGRARAALGVTLILALPGLLIGLFFLIILIAQPRWN